MDSRKSKNSKLEDPRRCLLFFLVLTLLFFGIYLLALLAYYPGVFAYDIHWQTHQAVGYLTYNSHHPPLHTFLWGLCIAAAGGGYEHLAGALVVYGVAQNLILSASLSHLFVTLLRNRAPRWLVAIAVVYTALNPVYAIFSFIMTKDVLFGAVWVCFFASFYQFLQELSEDGRGGAGIRKGRKAALFAEILLCCLLRNNAVPVFLILGVILTIYFCGSRKRAALLFLAPVALCLLISGPGYRLLGVEKGNMREAFSVPMVQISYTALIEWENLSPQLQSEISEFITIEEIRENFNPHFADPIKDVFRMGNDMGERKLLRLAGLYRKLFARYPGDYLRAFFELNRPYWNLAAVGRDAEYPRNYIETGIVLWDDLVRESKLPSLLPLYESVANFTALEAHPWLYPIYAMALPFWITAAAAVHAAVRRAAAKRKAPEDGGDRRKRSALWLLRLPVFLLWLTYMAGPVSLSRYILPLMLTCPAVLAGLFENVRKPPCGNGGQISPQK